MVVARAVSLAAACALLMSGSAMPATGLAPPVSFEQRLLLAHNAERVSVGAPPLRWNFQLAQGARQWADFLARSGRFEHSPKTVGIAPVGENIWGGTPGAFGPEAMVGLWVAERRDFQPGVFPANSRTGRVADVSHYTQVVWRRTTEVGCALSSGGAQDILVCRYSTAGNMIGGVVL
jgi:hypothetical protein